MLHMLDYYVKLDIDSHNRTAPANDYQLSALKLEDKLNANANEIFSSWTQKQSKLELSIDLRIQVVSSWRTNRDLFS